MRRTPFACLCLLTMLNNFIFSFKKQEGLFVLIIQVGHYILMPCFLMFYLCNMLHSFSFTVIVLFLTWCV